MSLEGTSTNGNAGLNQTSNVVFLETIINPDCDVSAGTNQTSVSFKVPANQWADGEQIEVMQRYTAFCTDGVATEDRYLKVDDTVTPNSVKVADAYAMPNNKTVYISNIFPYTLRRLGTHIYLENITGASPLYNAIAMSMDSNGVEVSAFTDLGTPDFTKEITISLTHTLSAASAGAIIKCTYAEAKLLKI